MDYKNLENKFTKLCDLIINHSVIEAINIFEDIMILDKSDENKIEFQKLKETYFYMLKYSALNIADEQRDKIYNSLLKSFLDLSDKIRESIYTQDIMVVSYAEKRRLKKFGIKLSNKINFLISNDVLEITAVEDLYNELFKIVLNIDKLNEDEVLSFLNFYNAKNININYKCIIISALTLSLFRCFDIKKISILLNIVEFEEKQLKLRALTGLILGFYIHDNRLKFYSEIKLKLDLLFENKEYSDYFEIVVLQLIKSKETEEIVQKLQNEIIPEMMKLTPKINKKLNLDKIISESLIEDKNPDWEEIFEDAPNVLNKMQELSELQLEGSDVLMGTFSALKFFPFFKQLKNWFVPFYKENPGIQIMFNDDEHTDVYKSVAIGLEKSAYMCNSDKYSFFLNIGNLPKMQKNMIINLFKMESEAIAEIKQDDILLNKNVENKEIITQYIQDLYRFFKIHPDKKEFNDFFSQKLDIYKKSFFDSCVDSLETYRNIAELYFKKNYYDDATEVFKILVQKGENRSEIFEKIGYSYQRLLNYQMALEFYHKADFFDVNKLWITKKIAFCYLKLNNYEKALEFYQKAEKENDQDLHTQTNIGLCYLNLEDHNNALKHYFKVEYFSPSNIKVLRPIAWCSFVNGKFDSAIKYYNKLIEKESTKYDFLNLAHSYWCSGDKPNAIKNYKIALEKNDDKDEFFKDFFEDYKYLLNNNIDAFEIKLLSEYLKVYFELEK